MNPVKEEGKKKKSKNTRRHLRSPNPGEERKKKRKRKTLRSPNPEIGRAHV